MRFAVLSYAVSVASAAFADPCEELCRRDPNCDQNMFSYCKVDHNPQTCHAYYFETADKTGNYYYHTAGDMRSEENPVLCDDAEDILDREPVAEVDYCELLCTVNEDCLNSGRGSYLKYWQNPAVCYSFVLTDAEGTDYFYWTGVGDDQFPMTNAQAERFYRAARA